MNDRIETAITINAELETVWDLVSEPGWWVGNSDGEPSREPGAVTVRRSEQHGTYPVRVERLDPRHYAAFRWASTFPGAQLTAGNTTLVEFTLVEVSGGVEVTVVESGFAALDASPEQRQQGFRDNSGGWREELATLQKRAETRAT